MADEDPLQWESDIVSEETFEIFCDLFKLTDDDETVKRLVKFVRQHVRLFHEDRPRPQSERGWIIANFLSQEEFIEGKYSLIARLLKREKNDSAYELFYQTHVEEYNVITRCLAMLTTGLGVTRQSIRTLNEGQLIDFLKIMEPSPTGLNLDPIYLMWKYKFDQLDFTVPEMEESLMAYPIPSVQYQCHRFQDNQNALKAALFPGKLLENLNSHVGRVKDQFEGGSTLAATAAPGAGKSTTLLLGLQQHFETMFVALPTNTTASVLFNNLRAREVDCGLVCGRPDDLQACPDPMSHPMVIVTYGVLKKFINNGLFPHLLVLDELFTPCDDKDLCMHMLLQDRQWKENGTKILGISAKHDDGSRFHLSSVDDQRVMPELDLDETASGRPAIRTNTLVLYCRKTHEVLTYLIILSNHSHADFVANVNDAMNQKISQGGQGIGEKLYRMIITYGRKLETWIRAWESPTVTMESILARTHELVTVLSADFINLLYPIVKRVWAKWYGYEIDYLAEAPISYVHYSNLKCPSDNGVSIVFVKGYREMLSVRRYIVSYPNPPTPLDVVLLHSKTIGMGELERATEVPKKNTKRRIILATSLAETSVTLACLKVVFDGTLTKASVWDPTTDCTTYINVNTSAAQREQRRGRAERGVDYSLYATWERRSNASDELITESLKMPNLQDVILELVVFYQKRGVTLHRQIFIKEIEELTFHEKDVIEKQLLILQEDYKFITKNLMVTLAGHHAYGLSLPCEEAFLVLLAARLGTFRSIAWATLLNAELEGGPPVNEKIDKELTYGKEWNAFFRKNVPHRCSRVLEYRAVALWFLHSTFPNESCYRATVSYQTLSRCRNEVTKMEEYLLKFGYSDISRHDNKPVLVLLTVAIGCNSRWGRRLDVNNFGVSDLQVFSTDMSTAQLCGRYHPQSFAAYNKLNFNMKDGYHTCSFTEIPGFLASIGFKVFCDPESADDHSYQIGNTTFDSEQTWVVHDYLYECDSRAELLRIRKQLKQVLLISFGVCPVWTDNCQEKIDEILKIVWKSFGAGGVQRTDGKARNLDIIAFVFNPRDCNAYRIADVFKLNASLYSKTASFDNPLEDFIVNLKAEVVNKELFRDQHGLPFAGGVARTNCCSRCHYRGHNFKTDGCPASVQEVLQRREKIALIPEEGLGTVKSRTLRKKLRARQIQPHAEPLEPVCWCGSIFHTPDFDDYKNNGHCRRCGSRKNHGPECRDALYYCTGCKIHIHMREHCFLDRLYMKRTYGSNINILEFREILDRQVRNKEVQEREKILVRKEKPTRFQHFESKVGDYEALQARFIDVHPEEVMPDLKKDVAFDSPYHLVYH